MFARFVATTAIAAVLALVLPQILNADSPWSAEAPPASPELAQGKVCLDGVVYYQAFSQTYPVLGEDGRGEACRRHVTPLDTFLERGFRTACIGDALHIVSRQAGAHGTNAFVKLSPATLRPEPCTVAADETPTA